MPEYPIFIHAGSDMGKLEQEASDELQIYSLTDPGVDMSKPFVELIPELNDDQGEEAPQEKTPAPVKPMTHEQLVIKVQSLEEEVERLCESHKILATILMENPKLIEELAADELLRDSVTVEPIWGEKRPSAGRAQEAAQSILERIRQKYPKKSARTEHADSVLELALDEDTDSSPVLALDSEDMYLEEVRLSLEEEQKSS